MTAVDFVSYPSCIATAPEKTCGLCGDIALEEEKDQIEKLAVCNHLVHKRCLERCKNFLICGGSKSCKVCQHFPAVEKQSIEKWQAVVATNLSQLQKVFTVSDYGDNDSDDSDLDDGYDAGVDKKMPPPRNSRRRCLQEMLQAYEKLYKEDIVRKEKFYIDHFEELEQELEKVIVREKIHLRGNELLEELDRAHASGVDVVGQLNAAVLSAAGVERMDDLEAIGFDIPYHLCARWNRQYPIFFLVQKFGLSYKDHLQIPIRNRKLKLDVLINNLRFTKQELLLLKTDMRTLLDDFKFVLTPLKKIHLLALKLSPLVLIDYLGAKEADLCDSDLAFVPHDFVENEQWRVEHSKSEQLQKLVLTLKKKK